MKRLLALIAAFAAAARAQTAPTAEQIAKRLTANDLKADVSFLASDALEGRATPSKGLDIAAEFVASQFRRAGLEPAGDDAYFQTASMLRVRVNARAVQLTFEMGGRSLKVDPGSFRIEEPVAADLVNAPAVRSRAAGVAGLTPESVRGKALVIEGSPSPESRAALRPAIIIEVTAPPPVETRSMPVLRDASAPAPAVPVLLVWDEGVRSALAASRGADVKVSAHIPAPSAQPLKLRNVIGVLRGSDAALNGSYLILSAHYDHLGVRRDGKGDRIYNGANDDASGVASVIEIANAFAASNAKPKRSIVVAVFFGEEEGEIGSKYYVRHPIFPLSKTIADLNLEQLGRTDGSGGPKTLQFDLTGFDYTTLAPALQKAAAECGVQVANDEENGDEYFSRSDNASFADAGVPSTTIAVTYMFPDYHSVGDEWPKLDYDNMAKVDCAVALGALSLAGRAETPRWNAENPRTEPYLKARQSEK